MVLQLERAKLLAVPAAIIVAVVGLLAWAASWPLGHDPKQTTSVASDLDAAVAAVDQRFDRRWTAASMQPAEPASELQVLRRLSLALHGTIPSLEEIRNFQSDQRPDRLRHWTDQMLADQRFADYFADRLAVAFVGDAEDRYPNFRREHFVAWLSEQLHAGRGYDRIVAQFIAQRGYPTSDPAASFVTAQIVQGEGYESRLAARTVRAFLGQRIDCAQCHDHPFEDWRQEDFEGLAAYFGQVRISTGGLQDNPDRRFEIEDFSTLEKRVIDPHVPFDDQWLPESGSRREQLAAWVTHPENRRFARAIVNRVWGLMFGRPYIAPVDDLPDPPTGEKADSDLLDILAADLQDHGYDMRRLVQVIAASRPFRLDSTHSALDDGSHQPQQLEDAWAVFPLVRLRPEQVIASLMQASSIKPIQRNSNFVTSTKRQQSAKRFVEEYGDLGEDELDDQVGTVPQTLMQMNGSYTRRLSNVNFMSGPGRIAMLAAGDANCLDNCYLVCLTRSPSTAEKSHFLAQLASAGTNEKRQLVEDIFWTLFNSAEFSWNH